MSKPTPAEPVKLIFSVFAATVAKLDEGIAKLSAYYGQPDFISDLVSFDYTDYYCREMGGNLVRRFLSMEELVRPEVLPDIKLATNGIENEFTMEGKRLVNIDPGYISKGHLILATGKGYAHRPYLRDGIYADLTLFYQNKKFCSLPWTYPDYADEKQLLMLNKIRATYLLQLKSMTLAQKRA
ncbi:MAG: DUF4416 family protein [Smithellaceae bacterium]